MILFRAILNIRTRISMTLKSGNMVFTSLHFGRRFVPNCAGYRRRDRDSFYELSNFAPVVTQNSERQPYTRRGTVSSTSGPLWLRHSRRYQLSLVSSLMIIQNTKRLLFSRINRRNREISIPSNVGVVVIEINNKQKLKLQRLLFSKLFIKYRNM